MSAKTYTDHRLTLRIPTLLYNKIKQRRDQIYSGTSVNQIVLSILAHELMKDKL